MSRREFLSLLKFNPKSIEKLIKVADEALERLQAELPAFANFLEQA